MDENLNQNLQPVQQNPLPSITPLETQPVMPEPQKPKNKWILLVGVLLLVCITVVATIVTLRLMDDKSNEEPGASKTTNNKFAKFTDPNFSIDLPKSWSGDAGYEPGAELVAFYSPENNSEAQEFKAANMIIYTSRSEFDRIRQQLDGLKKGGGSYKTISDETVKFGNYQGRYVEVIISTQEQPDKKIHLVSVAVKGAKKQYFIDITSLDEYWYLHEQNVSKMLRSFTPLD